MSWDGKNVLAVVPARGGSKGIPRKNLARVGGRTLVSRVADVVGALEWLDYAVLSTDDAAIADEGRSAGLNVPFMRPVALANDRATAADTWRQAWLASETVCGLRFDYSLLLEPTSALRRPDDVTRAMALLADRGCSSVVTVSAAPAHFTPERIFSIDAAGILRPYLADGLAYTARQMVAAYYYRNGVAYAVTRRTLLDNGTIIDEDTLALTITRPVVNIDEPIDLEWAEFLLQRESRTS